MLMGPLTTVYASVLPSAHNIMDLPYRSCAVTADKPRGSSGTDFVAAMFYAIYIKSVESQIVKV